VTFLRKCNDGITKGASALLVIAMAIIAITIPITVFSRYVLKNTPIWTDETALFALVWASMMGAAVGLRKGYQIGIRTLIEKAPKIISAVLEAVGFIFMLVFFGVLVYFGIKQTLFNTKQLSAALRLPMSIPYAALPLGFAIMLLFTLEEALAFIARLRGRSSGASKSPKEA
jgi:TRAP-type C4-dicarboxylate transport system permease small subunit